MTLFSRSSSPLLRTLFLFLFLLFPVFMMLAQEDEKLSYELIFLSDDPSLIASGATTNGIKTDKWVYTTKDSSFIQMGSYDSEGQKTGFWQVFIGGRERARMTYEADVLNGKYLLFHPNRIMIVSTFMKDGQLDGPWLSYTERNQKYEKGQFSAGNKVGTWTTFFPFSGQKEIKAEYKNGLLDGEYRQYSRQNEEIIKTSYSQGVLDGEWLKYDNENIVEKGYFIDGKRDSTWTFYEYGTFGTFPAAQEMYKEGMKTGTWISYHSNRRKASEITYENDKPVGVGRTWHSNKQLASETRYKLGLPDSLYTEYFKGGELAVEGNWNLGLKEGIWKYYHENSLIAEIGSFSADKKTGNWKAFNEKGRLLSEGNYRFGKEIGQWFNYHSNGNISSIGSYNAGEKDGLWGYFHTNGKPMAEETWRKGQLLSVSDFTTLKGKTLPTGTLKNGQGNRINYTPEGIKFSEGPYKNGLPNGQWTFFDEKEKKLMQGTITNGIKEGVWMIYSRSGRVVRAETFRAGELIDSVAK